MPLLRLASGFRLPLDAAGLLRRERKVRTAALLPLLVSAVALAAGVLAVVTWSGELWGLAAGWLPWPEPAAWWSWLWVGPVRLLAGAVGLVAFAALAGAIAVLAFLLGGVAAAPFLDRLSRRVEEVLTGSAVDLSASGLAGAALEETKRLVFFLGAQAAIAIPGAIVPGLQAPAAAAMVALTVFFLSLDSASYALDRRGLRFRAKLRWARSHLPAVAGYGVGAFALCSIPGLNVIALPLLVIAGTLLVVETERTPVVSGRAEE